MPWDLKYRPRVFDDVIGHDVTVKILRALVTGGSALDQSYVLSGPHGSGKTTLARILANAALCDRPVNGNPCLECGICLDFAEGQTADYEERDAASKGTLDDVRRVIADLDYVSAKVKVICWDEAHRMSNQSQDALLKPVEEHKLICIFATTEPTKIRGAIRSRCDDFSIRQVPIPDVVGRLKFICTKENVEFVDQALHLIAVHSGGHVRDAIKKAEMISRLGPLDIPTVKECLRLDVHSVAYRVLLGVAASDIQEVLSGLKSMMARVSPPDTIRVLARSALQAYRRGHQYGDEVDPLDVGLATDLFAEMGQNLPHVAAFLADRPGRLSQEAVECRLLSLTERLRLGIVQGPEHVLVGKGEAPVEEKPKEKPKKAVLDLDEARATFTGTYEPRGPKAAPPSSQVVVQPRTKQVRSLDAAKSQMAARFEL